MYSALVIKTTELREESFYLHDMDFKLSFSVLFFIEQVLGKVPFLRWHFLSLNFFPLENNVFGIILCSLLPLNFVTYTELGFRVLL